MKRLNTITDINNRINAVSDTVRELRRALPLNVNGIYLPSRDRCIAQIHDCALELETLYQAKRAMHCGQYWNLIIPQETTAPARELVDNLLLWKRAQERKQPSAANLARMLLA